MKKPSRLSYAYAVGRIRVLERRLVPSAVFREAAEKREFSPALKAIFDAGNFEEEMVTVQNSDELDRYLEREEEEILHLMRELILEEDILAIIGGESQPERVLSLAERLDYSFIRDYLRYRIDLGNIKILLRAKYSGLSFVKYKNLLMRGGFLEERMFLEIYDQAYSEIGERLRVSPYVDLWNQAIEELQENETFVPLERGIEDFLMAYLKKAKYIVFGPEPIFSYALAKRRELSLVRLVVGGKLLRIPSSLIKKRISETYV
ncbi:MAG: V-type ATPase subunit [Candidatus Aminicenantales bacterium]